MKAQTKTLLMLGALAAGAYVLFGKPAQAKNLVPSGRTVTVGPENNGQTVTLHVGDTLVSTFNSTWAYDQQVACPMFDSAGRATSPGACLIVANQTAPGGGGAVQAQVQILVLP